MLGQRRKVGFVGDYDQNVDVLRIRLQRRDGANQRDLTDAGYTPGLLGEFQQILKQFRPPILGLLAHAPVNPMSALDRWPRELLLIEVAPAFV